jgi:hypothetical protein
MCGSFKLPNADNGVADYIAYYQNTKWYSLGLTFTNTNPLDTIITVNSMVFNDTIKAPTLMYIAGKFNKVTSIGGPSNTSNFAIINLSTNQVITTPATASPPANYIINSLLKIGNFIYAGGTTAETGGNAFFARYTINTTGGIWTILSNTFPGTINVLHQITSTSTKIAIGGEFVSLQTATNCNNIVFYDTKTFLYSYFGAAAPYGVTDIAPDTPPYNTARVFTIATATIAKILYYYIGGYFVNAGGILCNSIVIYSEPTVATKVWTPYIRNGITGVLFNNYDGYSTTNPGIIYSIIQKKQDDSTIYVGGLFTVAVKTATDYTYNLFRITTSAANVYNKFYGKTITV